MTDLVSHSDVRDLGRYVFAVVEYRYDATIEALHTAAVFLPSAIYTTTLFCLLLTAVLFRLYVDDLFLTLQLGLY